VVLREMYVHGKLTPNLEALQPIFEEQSEKVLCQMLINFIETFKTVKVFMLFFYPFKDDLCTKLWQYFIL
jgi:hypothetical protein